MSSWSEQKRAPRRLMDFEKALASLLNSLDFIPDVLVKVVLEYWTLVFFESKPTRIVSHLDYSFPSGLISDQRFIYLCCNNSIFVYNLFDKLLSDEMIYHQQCPWSIDVCEGNLYIADSTKLSIHNIKTKTLTKSWSLPSSDGKRRSLKINSKLIYLTIQDHHQIFLYSFEGILRKKFGSLDAGSEPGEFNHPRGITIEYENSNDLYVCDCWNSRVQIINKLTGSFISSWGTKGNKEGEFDFPATVYIHESLIYIGDQTSLQIFCEKGNFFLQRIGVGTRGNNENQFDNIYGILMINEQLYVSDTFNNRVKVFRKSK